jgi:hypothetical protein
MHCNPSTRKAETEGSKLGGYPEQKRHTISKKKKKKKKKAQVEIEPDLNRISGVKK